MRSYIKRKGLKKFVVYLVILVALLFTSFPLYWLFVTSFKTRLDISHHPPFFIPPKWTLRNYTSSIVGKGEFPSALMSMKDSLIIALGNTLLTLLLALPAAYSIARFNTGGYNFAFWLLSNRFLPPIVFIIPLFLILKTIHMYDSYLSLIFIYTTFNVPFAVWLLVGFIQEIPPDLEEAAMVDGATRFTAFLRVTIPLAAPGIVATVLFCFLFAWNQYILPLLLTGEGITTLTEAIPLYKGGHDILYGNIAAVSLFSLIPGILFAYFLQRYMAKGLTMGAIK